MDEKDSLEINEVLEEELDVFQRAVKITKDGKQYSLKIPIFLIEELDINIKTDRFLFYVRKKGIRKLKGELIKNVI